MNAHGTKMTAITRELWNQWMTTKESWQDAKAVEFEKKYLEHIDIWQFIGASLTAAYLPLFCRQ